MYFEYGDTELNYLKQKDKILGAVIEQIGHVEREVDTDLFSSVVHQIIGQQISTKALATIWQRFRNGFEKIDAEHILALDAEELRPSASPFARWNTSATSPEKYSAASLIWNRSPTCPMRTPSKLCPP